MSFILALDAGHGGSDPGAGGFGIAEKDITLDVVNRIKAYLNKHYPSIKVKLTREKDQSVSLDSRTRQANGWHASCFLSIHVNSFANDAANGFESFVFTTDDENSRSFSLQKALHAPVAKLWTGKGRKDRGKKKANYHVLREFVGASVLIELGFISNQTDANLLKDDGFIQQNAEAIAEAVASWAGAERKTNGPSHLHKVTVDGAQVGAFADHDNILRLVRRSLESGKEKIEIQST